MTAAINQQVVQYIGDRLRTGFSGAVQTTTWPQVLQNAARLGNPVGEIRSGDDLARVPRNQQLRAVYFPSDPGGPVVRWGTGTMNQVLGGGNHDHFHRSGDNVTNGKQGYLTIDSSGNMTIQ